MKSRGRTIAIVVLCAALAVGLLVGSPERSGPLRIEETVKEGHEMTLLLRGLDCQGCGADLERRLAALPGVETVRLDFLRQTVHLAFTTEPDEAVTEKVHALTRQVSDAHAGHTLR